MIEESKSVEKASEIKEEVKGPGGLYPELAAPESLAKQEEPPILAAISKVVKPETSAILTPQGYFKSAEVCCYSCGSRVRLSKTKLCAHVVFQCSYLKHGVCENWLDWIQFLHYLQN